MSWGTTLWIGMTLCKNGENVRDSQTADQEELLQIFKQVKASFCIYA